METETSLLPCPFCGKQPVLICDEGTNPSRLFDKATVQCAENTCPVKPEVEACALLGQSASVRVRGYWNARATEAAGSLAVSARIARLRRLLERTSRLTAHTIKYDFLRRDIEAALSEDDRGGSGA